MMQFNVVVVTFAPLGKLIIQNTAIALDCITQRYKQTLQQRASPPQDGTVVSFTIKGISTCVSSGLSWQRPAKALPNT